MLVKRGPDINYKGNIQEITANCAEQTYALDYWIIKCHIVILYKVKFPLYGIKYDIITNVYIVFLDLHEY